MSSIYAPEAEKEVMDHTPKTEKEVRGMKCRTREPQGDHLKLLWKKAMKKQRPKKRPMSTILILFPTVA